MACSHRLADKYFTASLANSDNETCKFFGYAWDGSYENAQQILNDNLTGSACVDCPEMGINAQKSNKSEKFLVITSATEPLCRT